MPEEIATSVEMKETVEQRLTVAESVKKFNEGIVDLLQDPDEKAIFLTRTIQKIARLPNLEGKLPPPSLENDKKLPYQIESSLEELASSEPEERFIQGLLLFSKLDRELLRMPMENPDNQKDSFPIILKSCLQKLDKDGRFLLGFTAILAVKNPETPPSRLSETINEVIDCQLEEDYRLFFETFAGNVLKRNSSSSVIS